MPGLLSLVSLVVLMAACAADGRTTRDGGRTDAQTRDGPTVDGNSQGFDARPIGDAVSDSNDARMDAPSPDTPLDARDAGTLFCDPRFTLTPRPPRAGERLTVSFTDPVGHVYIGLRASGAGSPRATLVSITGSGPYTWTFDVDGLAPGRLVLEFTANMGSTVVGTCTVWVEMGTDAGVDAGVRDSGQPDTGTTMPPTNRFGIGFVGPGDTADLERAANLAGPGGYVKLIFPGIVRDTPGPDPSWSAAVRDAYARDLVPVIRMGPPWGDTFVRDQSDPGSGYRRYTQLAAAYRRVVQGLPLRPGWPLYVEVHNEPNLCYEWRCRAGSVPGDWISGDQIAAEYAAMLRDVADALHAIGDARIRVLNAGLAPGDVRRCQCGGDGYEAGATTLDFLRAMQSAVPDIFRRLDGFASHSYPAEGFGYGFFVPFDRARTGLLVFERELEVVGRSDLPVFMTETGWCQPGPRCPMNGGSRDQIADWTERAYQEIWLTHPRIRAVMPFVLRDVGWNDFAWVDPGGSPYPVYNRIRALRCRSIPGRCP